MTTIRPLTIIERAERAAHGWTCVRCQSEATDVLVPLGYALCGQHATEIGGRLEAAGLFDGGGRG